MTLAAEAMPFVVRLVRAADPAALYDAFEHGLGPLFPHHSLAASFQFEPDGGARSLWSSVPLPPRSEAWYRRYAELNPGLVWLADKPGHPVICMDEVIPDDELDAHPYFREFVAPDGWRHGLAILVWHQSELVGLVAVNRRADQGAFTAEERALARRLQPLVAAAWERIATHRVAEDVRRAEELLLASLPLAVLVWSPSERKVLFHNRRAREAIARWRGDEARNRPRGLSARRLPVEIAEARPGRRAVEVACPRGGLWAEVRRMDPRSHFASDVVLVVVHEEDRGVAPSAAWLRVASSLSTAELEAARLAAAGLSNAAIGRALGKSPATVKTQLEAVYAKAGVPGRAALAALFAGSEIRRTA